MPWEGRFGRADFGVGEQGMDAAQDRQPARASRGGVFIRPLCGMYRSTSTSRSPARAHRAPSWAGTRAEHGTPAASSRSRAASMASSRAGLTDGRCTRTTSCSPPRLTSRFKLPPRSRPCWRGIAHRAASTSHSSLETTPRVPRRPPPASSTPGTIRADLDCPARAGIQDRRYLRGYRPDVPRSDPRRIENSARDRGHHGLAPGPVTLELWGRDFEQGGHVG